MMKKNFVGVSDIIALLVSSAKVRFNAFRALEDGQTNHLGDIWTSNDWAKDLDVWRHD